MLSNSRYDCRNEGSGVSLCILLQIFVCILSVSLTYLMSNNGFAQMRGSIEILPCCASSCWEKNATFPGLPFPPPWLLLSPLEWIKREAPRCLISLQGLFRDVLFRKLSSLEPRQLGSTREKFSNTKPVVSCRGLCDSLFLRETEASIIWDTSPWKWGWVGRQKAYHWGTFCCTEIGITSGPFPKPICK